MSKTLHEIEQAIGTLPLQERLQLYKNMPQLIRRNVEGLDWQRLGLENFFQDDSREDFEKYLAASPDVPPLPGDEL